MVHLFNAFLKGKHLTGDADVDEEVGAFMRDFEIPAELVGPLRLQLENVAERVRNERRRRLGQ